VAVGNPVVAARTVATMRAILRDAPLGDLPDAANEARAVGRMYAQPRVLIGAEAREERVKDAAPSSDVLHFATHALVNDSQPLYSSIVLAGGDAAEDGLLEAREILGSDLRADLVVLSACSTARGEISPGEGLVGLTWSFLIAGASSTVAAQWPVVSKSTAELMIAFHKQLTSSPSMGKAEALRQAQLGIMRKRGYEHPFYWSPFVLVGAD
jgi:CHAT domain-containing protein